MKTHPILEINKRGSSIALLCLDVAKLRAIISTTAITVWATTWLAEEAECKHMPETPV